MLLTQPPSTMGSTLPALAAHSCKAHWLSLPSLHGTQAAFSPRSELWFYVPTRMITGLGSTRKNSTLWPRRQLNNGTVIVPPTSWLSGKERHLCDFQNRTSMQTSTVQCRKTLEKWQNNIQTPPQPSHRQLFRRTRGPAQRSKCFRRCGR